MEESCHWWRMPKTYSSTSSSLQFNVCTSPGIWAYLLTGYGWLFSAEQKCLGKYVPISQSGDYNWQAGWHQIQADTDVSTPLQEQEISQQCWIPAPDILNPSLCQKFICKGWSWVGQLMCNARWKNHNIISTNQRYRLLPHQNLILESTQQSSVVDKMALI